MHAAGELGQGGGPVHALHELIHVQTAGQVQGSGKLPVDRVLHDDVHHGTAAVHHGVELVPCLLGRVYTGDAAQQAILCGDHIAPCGGGDLLTGGTQQGDIPHNDLTADAQLLRKGRGADRRLGCGKQPGDLLAALRSSHSRHGKVSSFENLWSLYTNCHFLASTF